MKIKPTICYVIASVLLAGYMIILVISTNYSRTTDLYKAYYIDKKMTYFVDEKTMFEEYGTDTEIMIQYDGSFHNLGKGWGDVKETATWCTGYDSSFFIYVPNIDQKYVLVFDIISNEGFDNYLYVNDKLQGNIIVVDGKAEIVISDEFLKKGLNEFRIHRDDYEKSSNKDEHNLYVHSVMLRSEE